MWLSTAVAATGVVIAFTMIESRKEHPPVEEELAEAAGPPLAEIAAVQADG
jgi:hypothetical protein